MKAIRVRVENGQITGDAPPGMPEGDVDLVLADEDDFAGMNEEYVKVFPSNPPARQGAKLPVRVPGMKVSIAAIAEA